MNWFKSVTNTIFKRMFVPVMCVLIAQAVLSLFIFNQAGIVQQAKDAALTVLSEHVSTRKIYLENEMTNRWSNLSEGEVTIVNKIKSVLRSEKKTADDIYLDYELNKLILSDIAEELIYILRKNNVTGVFLILDGAALSSEASTQYRPGLYIRDLDPVNKYEDNYGDLIWERGLSSLSKKYGISLSSYWQATFRFSEYGTFSNEQFFFSPLNALRNTGEYTGSASDYGYWSPSFSLSEKDKEVIAYSIPLVIDGTIVGVLGIDITLDYLNSFMKYDELDSEKTSFYYLGMMIEGSDRVRRVATNGPTFNAYFGETESLAVGASAGSADFTVTAPDANATLFYGSMAGLSLYNSGTPFENQQWVIMGVRPERSVLLYAQRIQMVIQMSLLLSLTLGIISVFVASETISRPISRLAKGLKNANPERPIVLGRLNIAEIDMLSGSIEELSRSVAESASKLTKTLEMMDLPVGVIEYNRTSKRVFCSKKWFEYAVGNKNETDRYIDADEFESHLDVLGNYRVKGEDDIYMIPGERPMWLRLTIMDDGNLTYGALSDITKEMVEKMKIEYERDYDVLSDLFNRRAFEANVARIFEEEAQIKNGALIMWDLDNLKYINDTYGHVVGDQYICALADVLRTFDKDHSIAARRSGDEFYVFIYGYDSREPIEEQIQEVWQELQRAFWQLPDGSEMRIRVSAGVAWYPGDAKTIEELVHYADFAMYNVKHTNKGRLKDFNMATYVENSVLVNGTEALNQLLEGELVDYHFQPIINAATGGIFGYEMLMRSRMKELPTVGDILRLATAQSKLDEIERLTFFKAAETFSRWMKKGDIQPGTKMFINSIAGQMLSTESMQKFEAEFFELLDDLVVEITESQSARTDLYKEKKGIVVRWGSEIALDDYGSGYNNESLLLRVSPHFVKVDISIISGIDKNENQQTVLKNLISYAKPRGIRVLAEGVETAEEVGALRAMGVEFMQGYFFGRPSPTPNIVNQGSLEVLLGGGEQQ